MLQVDEQIRSSHLRANEVLEKWSEEYPGNVCKGRTLYQSGELDRLRLQGAPAKEVINCIHEFSKIVD
jgi:hypothetical protein